MSDTDSDAESISDSSNAHVDYDDDDDGDDEALLTVRELCNQLRANDPRLVDYASVFDPYNYIDDCSEAESIDIFQALKENTSVKHIRLWMNDYSKT
jgi:hypothetical protein